MAVLYVEDLNKLLYLYESSPLRFWEIVRTFHPTHMTALMYTLRNIAPEKDTVLYISNATKRMMNSFNCEDSNRGDVNSTTNNDCIISEESNIFPGSKRKTLFPYKINKRPTISRRRVKTCFKMFNKSFDYNYINKNIMKSRINGRLTIIGLMNIIRGINKDSTTSILSHIKNKDTMIGEATFKAVEEFNVEERIAIHNMCTPLFQNFATHGLKSLIIDSVSDNSRNDKNSDQRIFQKKNESLEKFTEYIESMRIAFDSSFHYEYNKKNSYINSSSPKSLRYILRPRPIVIRENGNFMDNGENYLIRFLSSHNMSELCIQPLLKGLFVVINIHEREVQCYNRYGVQVHRFTSVEKFDFNSATFEAVMLPVNANDELRNWNYWPYRKGYAIYVTDVFRIGQRTLIHLPFKERVRNIDLLTGPGIINVDLNNAIFHTKTEDFLTNYEMLLKFHRINSPNDIATPLCGVIIRNKNDSVMNSPWEYRFPLEYYYNFIQDSFVGIYGDISMYHESKIYFDLEMSPNRTVISIYSHDRNYFYVCQFDRIKTFQFRHIGILPRINTIYCTSFEPKYSIKNIYIINAKVTPRGISFIRVYYDDNDDIIGYDTKSTISMHDVSTYNPLFMEKDCNKKNVF